MTTFGVKQWSGQTWAESAAQANRLPQLAAEQEALRNGGFIDTGASKVLAPARAPVANIGSQFGVAQDSVTPMLTINVASTMTPNRAFLSPPGAPQLATAGNTVLNKVNVPQ